MTVKAVFLQSAEADLKELRRYIVKNFGQGTWQSSYGDIKQAVEQIQSFPLSGVIPDELARLQIHQYRQVVAGMNRLIYEAQGEFVYIHIVCDTRRDFTALLMRRLLNASS